MKRALATDAVASSSSLSSSPKRIRTRDSNPENEIIDLTDAPAPIAPTAPAKCTDDTDNDTDATEIDDAHTVHSHSSREATPVTTAAASQPAPVNYIDPRIRLVRVRDLPAADNVGSKSLRELFTFKPLECMLQLNYMVELEWMLSHLQDRSIPVTIVHGLDKAMMQQEAAPYPNVTVIKPWLPIAYGTHHTKAMFLVHKAGTAQFIIHTANLISRDFTFKTQGMWLSPVLQKKSATDVPCAFERDLMEYFDEYGSSLRAWRDRMAAYDWSPVRAVLVGSVPGRHTGAALRKWGHLRLRRCLERVTLPPSCVADSVLIAQVVGSLGTNDSWLVGEFARSLATAREGNGGLMAVTPPLKLIFPTVDDVRTSLEGWAGSGSLPFDHKNWTSAEPYMRPRLHAWEATRQGRHRAVPHIKTFTRINTQTGEMAWFLLTSANLSKAAWGQFEKKDTQLMIRSFELGVLIAPESFKSSQDQAVTLKAISPTELAGLSTKSAKEPNPELPVTVVPLRLPYDLPLRPYAAGEKPWTRGEEVPRGRDSLGDTFQQYVMKAMLGGG
ncbi:tyrosyl-DNA phosphodiesterase 1 [Geranomyces variabilis]|uniref:Tyrosyl-DNA phosphodiesterase 1 n=1 Tax=Geranomyces variabilis TaxID=109894 RepID=A0AAD5TP61_9FUNG|nr:tyrosyl-DNA phosphodiesterase 1 [Geranomyces variabilis]